MKEIPREAYAFEAKQSDKAILERFTEIKHQKADSTTENTVSTHPKKNAMALEDFVHDYEAKRASKIGSTKNTTNIDQKNLARTAKEREASYPQYSMPMMPYNVIPDTNFCTCTPTVSGLCTCWQSCTCFKQCTCAQTCTYQMYH